MWVVQEHELNFHKLSLNVTTHCRIWGSCSGDYEHYCLLVYVTSLVERYNVLAYLVATIFRMEREQFHLPKSWKCEILYMRTNTVSHCNFELLQGYVISWSAIEIEVDTGRHCQLCIKKAVSTALRCSNSLSQQWYMYEQIYKLVL
jgi:hypothetical protein